MTSLDVRDMLDLPSSAGPRPAKKQKTSGPRPNLKGLQREVQSLGGDNPIVIVPEVPLFKKRRIANRKPAARWDLKQFKNSARKDGLILRHWRRVADGPAPQAEGDADVMDEGADGQEKKTTAEAIDDSMFAKFSVQVNLPKYNDEQYNANLKNEDWSRPETDYLMGLAGDLDLRWPVIWDRYEYNPAPTSSGENNSQALVLETKTRSLEDLKARYYDVAAKMMAIHRPIHNMSQAEFSLHQLMSSFNPAQERIRKQFAEAAMSRSAEERKEEESLLLELKRIMARSEKLNEERRELYARLDAPPSTSNIGIYSTSAGLQQLVQQLMTADKSRKSRKSIVGPETESPAAAVPTPQPAAPDRRDSVRESVSGTTSGKKGSMSIAEERRPLSKEDESLYGVSHHERLTGGPWFRHEKVTKLINNKSASQATKITNTLAELEIPLRLTMPTTEVVAAHEALLSSINALLDARKVADKLDGEIKILEVQKKEKERVENGGAEEEKTEDDKVTEVAEVADVDDADDDVEEVSMQAADEHGDDGDDADDADVQGDQEEDVVEIDVEEDEELGEEEEDEEEEEDPVEQEGEDEEEEEDPEVKDEIEEKESFTPSTRAGNSVHKRSASELSQVSDKSTKRQRR